MVLMFDLPRPTRIHRLGGGVGKDRLGGPVPTADNGPVAEQGLLEIDERLFQRFP